MKVLLVDENPYITRFLIINLKKNGFEAPVARSVKKAMEAVDGTKVDAVALASSELIDTRRDIACLRRAFGCPILVYGLGGTSSNGDDGYADNYLFSFQE